MCNKWAKDILSNQGLVDRSLLEHYKFNARQVAELYGVDNITALYKNLFNEILKI